MAIGDKFKSYLSKATSSKSTSVTSDNMNAAIDVPNTYSIFAEISNLSFSQPQQSITYYEYHDYLKNNFPIRRLTITMSHTMLITLRNATKVEVDGYGEMYKVVLSVKPSESGSQHKPFSDGIFYGQLQDNNSNLRLDDGNTTDSALFAGTVQNTSTTVTFILYREDEISFSVSNDLNTVYTNPTLSQVFINSLVKTNPNLKCIISDFDHDPSLGTFVVPPMCFTDLVKLLEREVGFYDTNYLMYVEDSILYMLNTSNLLNCENDSLETNLIIYSDTGDGSTEQKKVGILKNSETSYSVSIPETAKTVEKVNNESFKNTLCYITPSGKRFIHENALSRNMVTINKQTEVEPVKKQNNINYEKMSVTINNNAISILTPMSKIATYNDLKNMVIYRLYKKEIQVTSNSKATMILEGMRILDKPSTSKDSKSSIAQSSLSSLSKLK
jgi:hypothetical protein